MIGGFLSKLGLARKSARGIGPGRPKDRRQLPNLIVNLVRTIGEYMKKRWLGYEKVFTPR